MTDRKYHPTHSKVIVGWKAYSKRSDTNSLCGIDWEAYVELHNERVYSVNCLIAIAPNYLLHSHKGHPIRRNSEFDARFLFLFLATQKWDIYHWLGKVYQKEDRLECSLALELYHQRKKHQAEGLHSVQGEKKSASLEFDQILCYFSLMLSLSLSMCTTCLPDLELERTSFASLQPTMTSLTTRAIHFFRKLAEISSWYLRVGGILEENARAFYSLAEVVRSWSWTVAFDHWQACRSVENQEEESNGSTTLGGLCPSQILLQGRETFLLLSKEGMQNSVLRAYSHKCLDCVTAVA